MALHPFLIITSFQWPHLPMLWHWGEDFNTGEFWEGVGSKPSQGKKQRRSHPGGNFSGHLSCWHWGRRAGDLKQRLSTPHVQPSRKPQIILRHKEKKKRKGNERKEKKGKRKNKWKQIKRKKIHCHPYMQHPFWPQRPGSVEAKGGQETGKENAGLLCSPHCLMGDGAGD